MTETTSDLISSLPRLSEQIRGSVLLPGTEAYDDARTGFQRRDLHRPAVAVVAADAADVGAAVAFAAEHGAPVAAQSSGHGLGRGLDGGILISTHELTEVRVDEAERTAWVEAGASWQKVIEAAAPYKLAPLSGSSPGVGVVGYTLGGGIGLMARRHGFAADHVRRIDLVTADGRLHQVTADADPELFWALRGGGASFGVVTGIEIELVAVTHLYGGGLYLDVKQTPDVLDRWRYWTRSVPEEMSSAVAMLVFPDLPMVPEPLRGRHVAQVQIAFLGTEADGARLVEPLRALGPVLDSLAEIPYTESGSVFDEPDRPHAYSSTAVLVDDLEPAALARLTEVAGPAAAVRCVVGVRHLGGALRRTPEVANAVGHRDAAYSLMVLCPVEPGDEQTVRDLQAEALAPFAGRVLGRLPSFSYGPLAADDLATAFTPEDFQRLRSVKTRLDPADLIRANHPIPPAT